MTDRELAHQLAAALVEIARIRLIIDSAGGGQRMPSVPEMHQLMDGIEGGLLDA